MKLMNIYPVGNIQTYERQDANMFLTHLVLDHTSYRNMAKNHPGYKILDNSLIELGEAISFDLVLWAAKEIGADEVILPDKFKDGITTIEYVERTLEVYKDELKDYKVMAVVHGKDLEEVAKTWKTFTNNPDIDVLGIPKVWTKQFGNRSEVLNDMIGMYGKGNKEVHLLGLWNSFRELEDLNCVDQIRSIDTSLAVLYDIMGKHLGYIREDDEVIDLVNQKVNTYTVSEEAVEFVRRLE